MSDPRPNAVVIGAAAGIGHAITRRLHHDGYALRLADLDEGRLDEIAAPLGVPVFALDIADQTSLRRFAHICGGIDALVIAAGVSQTMAPFARILEVNLGGTALAIDVLRGRMRRGGCVVCLSSMAGHLAGIVDEAIEREIDHPLDPDLSARVAAVLPIERRTPPTAYTLSKVGVLRLVRREAVALGGEGVRVCSVSPGPIDTPMGSVERGARPAAYDPVEFMPVPRMGTGEEVASVVAFLASSQASYVTGTDVLVDGGWLAAHRCAPS